MWIFRASWPLLVAILLLPLAVISGARAASVGGDNDHLIVPGQRVGPVKLGMSDKELFKLGVPNLTRPYGKRNIYFYDDMEIITDDNVHNIVLIAVNDDSYHTAEGVRIGPSIHDIEAAYGPPTAIDGSPFFGNQPMDLSYDSGNLKFDFMEKGSNMSRPPSDSVQKIIIQSPGTTGL